MKPIEIILTILVWLAVIAVFLHFRRKAGLEFLKNSRSGNHPESPELNRQGKMVINKTTL
jgi:hypothetical protein